MAVDVKEILDKAIVSMVLDFPIYANLVTRIGVKLVDEPKHRVVAWTDGRGIYINEAMVKEFNEDPMVTGDSGKTYNRTIGKNEMIFIVCHEMMHLLNLTFDRGNNVGVYRGAADPKSRHKWELWNQATDYEINSRLHNNESKDSGGCSKRSSIGNMPDWVLYESEYKDMQAERIYEKLLENEDEEEENGSDSNLTFDTGNNVDGLDFSLDEHIPMFDDATRNEVINKMAEVFGSSDNGTGETALDRSIENTYKPQPFNWRRALTKYIRGWMKDNYTWNKPSRAGIANNLILPSAGKTPKMHLAVAVDTSGSIYDTELHTMMDHLFTILTQFKDFVVDVWCCGSQVYKETFRTYTSSNKRDVYNFQFQSDGGNDMRENFKFMKEHYKGDKPDVFICMSDFYDPLDGDTETTSICPVIYMCLDHDSFVPPSKIKGVVYPFEVESSKNR